MDRYILAKLKDTIIKIDESFEKYDTPTACEIYGEFFENLNNWYIRRSRNRFWSKKDETNAKDNQEKQDAYDVLYTVLLKMSESIAPVLPFTSEYVWKGNIETHDNK